MHGLSGAHRTGKTTLAIKTSEAAGIPYLKFDTASVFEKLGTTFSDIQTVSDRIEVQRAIIQYAHNLYRDQVVAFVTDRTPVDIAAYLMADITANVGTPAEQSAILEMYEDCIDITAQHFKTIVCVPPGIPYVAAEGKPPMNAAYQMHHHLLCLGISKDTRLIDTTVCSIRKNVINLDDRVSIMMHILGGVSNQAVFEASVAVHH